MKILIVKCDCCQVDAHEVWFSLFCIQITATTYTLLQLWWQHINDENSININSIQYGAKYINSTLFQMELERTQKQDVLGYERKRFSKRKFYYYSWAKREKKSD